MPISRHPYTRTPVPPDPYRGFEHYVAERREKSRRPVHKFGAAAEIPEYPCQDCDGSGRILHPDAFNDPVEGHKMSERIYCPMCQGSGTVTRNQMRVWWGSIKAEHAARRLQARKRREDEDKIIPKLNRMTKRDICAIRRLLQ